ncbi:MAG: outer membrane protein assembly factor BamB [Proteobacteria bacterium]|nr:outer membrane protein assembly factor BamB [Pseudomonadota bacterium]
MTPPEITLRRSRPLSRHLLRGALIATAFATLVGCTTIKGWVNKVGGGDNAHQPTPLTAITPSIRVQKLWTRSVGKGERLLGLRDHPAIDGNRVYAIEPYGPNILALDLGSGREVWKTHSKYRFTGGPAAGAGVVVAGSVNGDVLAYAADTGAERWHANVSSEVISAPLIAGDEVIVRSGDGHVAAFGLADGQKRWAYERNMPSLILRGNAAPVLGPNGLVYLGYADGTLVALRAADGVKAWEQVVAQPEGRSDIDRLADIDGHIVVDPDAVFAASYKGKVGAYNPETGQPGWTHSLVAYGGLARSGGSVFVSDASGTVWALDRATGTGLWKQDKLAWRWLSTPAVQDGYVVVGDLQGYLHWLAPDTGAIVARERIGGNKDAIRGTPQVSADGILVAMTAGGKLAAFKIAK